MEKKDNTTPSSFQTQVKNEKLSFWGSDMGATATTGTNIGSDSGNISLSNAIKTHFMLFIVSFVLSVSITAFYLFRVVGIN